MPFIAFVHAEDPDERPDGRRPWEPNWKVWRWLLAAVFFGYGATQAQGAIEAIFMIIVFGLVCRAAEEALPKGDGLREYRQ
jgi:hypothetical protein